jgi:transcriptional regulator with XRE-family HTH domain
MSFAKRFKQIRIKKGFNQKEMANLLHMSNSTISSYERSEITPCLEVLVKIAKTLNVSVDYLLCLSDCPYPLHSTKTSPYSIHLPISSTKEQHKLIQKIANEILNVEIKSED